MTKNRYVVICAYNTGIAQINNVYVLSAADEEEAVSEAIEMAHASESSRMYYRAYDLEDLPEVWSCFS